MNKDESVGSVLATVRWLTAVIKTLLRALLSRAVGDRKSAVVWTDACTADTTTRSTRCSSGRRRPARTADNGPASSSGGATLDENRNPIPGSIKSAQQQQQHGCISVSHLADGVSNAEAATKNSSVIDVTTVNSRKVDGATEMTSSASTGVSSGHGVCDVMTSSTAGRNRRKRTNRKKGRGQRQPSITAVLSQLVTSSDSSIELGVPESVVDVVSSTTDGSGDDDKPHQLCSSLAASATDCVDDGITSPKSTSSVIEMTSSVPSDDFTDGGTVHADSSCRCELVVDVTPSSSKQLTTVPFVCSTELTSCGRPTLTDDSVEVCSDRSTTTMTADRRCSTFRHRPTTRSKPRSADTVDSVERRPTLFDCDAARTFLFKEYQDVLNSATQSNGRRHVIFYSDNAF